MISHFDLYSRLRAAIIARRFAIDRGRYMYLFSEGGLLSHPEVDPLDLNNALTVRYDIALDDFKKLSADQQQMERERVWERWDKLTAEEKTAARERSAVRTGENPWLFFTPMAIALATEVRLGLQPAATILNTALDAFAAMFRCSGAFAGYPIRWDPVTSEPGIDVRTGGNVRSGEFLLNSRGQYDFTGPRSDLRAYPWRPEGILRNLMPAGANIAYELERIRQHHRWFQRWEPSQDEVLGMLGLAWAAGSLSGDAALRTRTAALLRPLAEYLARHGYLLVKPGGGLVPRGHGDSLIGAQLAISQLFESLLGSPYPPSTNWPGAMQLAGLWPSLETAWTGGGLIGGVLDVVSWLSTGAKTFSFGLFNATTLASITSVAADPALASKLGKMIGVWSMAAVFDSYKGEGAGDPALSAFLHEFTDTQKRYDVFMTVMAVAHYSAPASGFVPVFSLFGLDAANSHVRDAYLTWFSLRSARATDHTPLFALAVACLLAGDGRWENELRQRLDQERDKLEQDHSSDLPIEMKELDAVGNRWALIENALPTVDYCGALALAWLHAQRQQAAGKQMVNGFPTLPTPPPMLLRPRLANFPDIFANDQVTPREVEGPIVAEPLPNVLARPDVDKSAFRVPANGGDQDTGVTIHFGDVFQIDASPGGVTFPFETLQPIGPEGHPTPVLLDPSWPVHVALDPRARAYALVGRLNGWFHIGNSTGQQRWLYGNPDDSQSRRLYLRVNQDAKKIGASGAFTVRIRVWRYTQPDPNLSVVDESSHRLSEVVLERVEQSDTTAYIYIHNRGTTALTRVSASATGFAATEGITVEDVPPSMDANTIYVVTLRIRPTRVGEFPGELQLNSSDPLFPSVTVPLKVKVLSLGNMAIYEFMPNPVIINARVNSSTSSSLVTITNSGAILATSLSESIEPAAAQPLFLLGRDIKTSDFQPGQPSKIPVFFYPTAAGTFNAELVLTYGGKTSNNFPYQRTLRIPIVGNASAPMIRLTQSGRRPEILDRLFLDVGGHGRNPWEPKLDPAIIEDFGIPALVIAIGTIQVPANDVAFFFIGNVGNEPLEVINIISNYASISAQSNVRFPCTIDPGQEKKIWLDYGLYGAFPSGTFSEILRIISNDPITPEATVTLQGTIPGAKGRIRPEHLNFRNVAIGTASTMTTQFENEGTVDLHIHTLTWDHGKDFRLVQVPQTGSVIAARTALTLEVEFAPQRSGFFVDRLIIDTTEGIQVTLGLEANA